MGIGRVFEGFVYAVADCVRGGAVGVGSGGGVDYDAGSGGVCVGSGIGVGQDIGGVDGVFSSLGGF